MNRPLKNTSIFIRLAVCFFIVCLLLMPSVILAEAKNDREVTFNFVDVDLPVITKFVSEITHKNFILDERIR
jgi:type II secretory pathway component GspD/PulD (secretin)